MPIGLTQFEVNGFYSLPEMAFGKSVQPTYKFVASFLENPFDNKYGDVGPMPVIMPWHITSVNVPNYKFKVEKVMYGNVPRLYQTLDFEGLQFRVSFEEDELGTIAFFINWLQRRIIDNNGYYNAPSKTKIGHFVIEIQDKNGFPVVYYVFKNIVFNDATDPTFDYSSNEVLKYDITFVSEVLETWFVKYGMINKAQSNLSDMSKGMKLDDIASRNDMVNKGVNFDLATAFQSAISK